tara:strand:+ start:2516 stop:3370 length:855 start_codon:yes stop_codon:yes gene_type:complete
MAQACTYKTAQQQLDARSSRSGTYEEIITFDGRRWRSWEHGINLVGQKIILFGKRNRKNPITDAGWRVVRVDKVVKTFMGRATKHIVSMDGPDGLTYREKVTLNSSANPWSRGFGFVVVDQTTLTGDLDTTTDDPGLLSLARWSRDSEGNLKYIYDTNFLYKYEFFNDLPRNFFDTLGADPLKWISKDEVARNNIALTRFMLQNKSKQAYSSLKGLDKLKESGYIDYEEWDETRSKQTRLGLALQMDDKKMSKIKPSEVPPGQFDVEMANITTALEPALSTGVY